jgi:hypothetical protein
LDEVTRLRDRDIRGLWNPKENRQIEMHAERNNKPKLEETKPKLANQNDHDRRRNSEFRLAMKSRRTAAATAIYDGGRRIVIPDFEQRTWYLTSGAVSAD